MWLDLLIYEPRGQPAMRRKHEREIRLLSTCDSKSGIDGEDAIVGLRLVIKSRLQEISTKPARLKISNDC